MTKHRRWTGATFGGDRIAPTSKVMTTFGNRRKGLFQELKQIFNVRMRDDDIDFLVARFCENDVSLKLLHRPSLRHELELASFELCSRFLHNKKIFLSSTSAGFLLKSPTRFHRFPASGIGVQATKVIQEAGPIARAVVIKKADTRTQANAHQRKRLEKTRAGIVNGNSLAGGRKKKIREYAIRDFGSANVPDILRKKARLLAAKLGITPREALKRIKLNRE
jgi:hypothetical protein